MTERRTIRKWIWVWDFDKEETWLNEMAMQGWALCDVGFCKYVFEKCESGEYTIRLEMREPDSGYIDFMEQTGAFYIGRIVKWIYFRKKTIDGPFDIFSDRDSRIAHLDKIGKMLSIVGFANLLIGITNPVGSMNLLGAALLMYALGRIHEKTEELKRDRQILE